MAGFRQPESEDEIKTQEAGQEQNRRQLAWRSSSLPEGLWQRIRSSGPFTRADGTHAADDANDDAISATADHGSCLSASADGQGRRQRTTSTTTLDYAFSTLDSNGRTSRTMGTHDANDACSCSSNWPGRSIHRRGQEGRKSPSESQSLVEADEEGRRFPHFRSSKKWLTPCRNRTSATTPRN